MLNKKILFSLMLAATPLLAQEPAEDTKEDEQETQFLVHSSDEDENACHCGTEEEEENVG